MKTWNIYILLALLLLGACTDEERIDPPTPPAGGSDLTTLTLKFPKSALNTKAFSAGDENAVKDLHILAYTKATGTGVTLLDDVFAYSIKVPASEITNSTTTIDGDTKTAKIKVKNMEAEQRFILLANLPSGLIGSADTVEGSTKVSALLTKLEYNATSHFTWMKDGILPQDSGFPMWGQMPNHIQFYHTNNTVPSSIEINMIRAVARIDVGLDIDGTGDPALGFGSITELDSVYLCDANTKGNIIPHDDYLKTTAGATEINHTKTNVPSSASSSRIRVGYEYTANEGRTMVRTIYTPESDTLKTTSPTNTPAFLIVKAKYYDEYTYYRVDFTDNGKYVPLLRNHRYTINILGARAKGYDTLQEALNAPPTLVNPSLILNVAAELELREVASNDQYYLAYSANEIKVDWNGQLRIPVMTDFPDGWTATADGSVTLATASGNAGTIGYVTTTTLPNITSGGPREFTVTLKAGTLTRTVKVTQIIGSTSYMVAPNGTIQIPVNSANLGGDILSSVSNIKIQELWDGDTNTTFSEALGIITVNAGSTAGNMVISLMGEGGPGMVGGTPGSYVVWSWHIWVTDYNPDSQNAIPLIHNGYIFMDRNLGGTGDNLYYQWGRKDPFKDGEYTVMDAPLSQNLDESIKNPTVFFRPTISPFDWMGTSQNNNLWTTSTGEKAPYDPCPFGWRVPVSDAWTGFSGNLTHGINLPAAGNLELSGNYVSGGYAVWSATASGQNAYLYNGTATPRAQRGFAYPVRCVKDIK